MLVFTYECYYYTKIFQFFQFSYKAEDADWSRDMRGANLISTINLNKWMILFSSRDKGIAQDFYQTLQKVNPPMGIEVNKPEM